ncbi:hypothetical protein DFQ26_002228 [Actinomortierella ambigua]|nr:hypothetical protein DFQ26_002228 [Actinomortierella ambigua]
MIANSKSSQQPLPHSSLHDAFIPGNSHQQGLKVASTAPPAKHSNGLSATDSVPARNPKHLSTPYTLQSISTESLPALMGAASLRRTHSNITTKVRSASRGGSPPILSKASFSSSSPSSPISERPTGAPALGPASAAPAVPPPRTRLTRTNNSAQPTSTSMENGTQSTPASPPSVQQQHLEQVQRRTIPRSSTTTPIDVQHDIMDPFESSLTLEEHERRPSSWDIMDMLAIEQLHKWMVCFCVVNFDLEKGQGKRLGAATPNSVGPTTDAGFLYGYVFFRQKQDPSIRRGYFQKSVVILTQHPFVGLFSRLVSVLGPAYFEVGKPMLEAAFHNIASWRAPTTESIMELPFMGTLYQVQLAHPHQPQLLETAPFEIATYQPDTHILSSVPMNGGLYRHFQDLVPDLWLCWELMTLAEPIMLIGTSPEVCSEAVTSLVDLINPIPYCGDYRPYFTIQDTDFKSFCNKTSPPSSIVLGVTNPFFVKTLEHWPHVIKIGKPKATRPNNRLVGGHAVASKGSEAARHIRPSTIEFVQGVVSKRKSVIAKDSNLLCMLAEATANRSSPDYLLDNILRRHFSNLTEKFLVPLNRYFATLVPTDISLSSASQMAMIAPFKQQDFLKYVSKNPPAFSFKTTAFKSNSEACQNFYKDFMRCGNFATWLRLKTTEAQKQLRRRYLDILCLGDISGWVKGRNEVELVDLLVRMREELETATPAVHTGGHGSGGVQDRRTLARERRQRALGGGGGGEEVDGGSGGVDLSRQWTGSSAGGDMTTESRTVTPPPLLDDRLGVPSSMHPSPVTPIPSRSLHSTREEAAALSISRSVSPVKFNHNGLGSAASSYSSSSPSPLHSRPTTPSRTSSSSSVQSGGQTTHASAAVGKTSYASHGNNSGSGSGSSGSSSSSSTRESSSEEEYRRRRREHETASIQATGQQREQLRDQIRLLIEALPKDLRESLKANEAKKQQQSYYL